MTTNSGIPPKQPNKYKQRPPSRPKSGMRQNEIDSDDDLAFMLNSKQSRDEMPQPRERLNIHPVAP